MEPVCRGRLPPVSVPNRRAPQRGGARGGRARGGRRGGGPGGGGRRVAPCQVRRANMPWWSAPGQGPDQGLKSGKLSRSFIRGRSRPAAAAAGRRTSKRREISMPVLSVLDQ